MDYFLGISLGLRCVPEFVVADLDGTGWTRTHLGSASEVDHAAQGCGFDRKLDLLFQD